MLIRNFRSDDAHALAALFHASVREVGSRDYSSEQIMAWSPAEADPASIIERASDGRVFLVAVNDGGEPVAYGDLEANGHLDHLYCRPDTVGTGTASALYDRLEAIAIERGIPAIHVEASEAARRLFERRGFVVDHRRDFVVRGVPIHNFMMVKQL